MQDNEKESRADGYKNLMNKYGTQDDVSEQYRFESDDPVTDVELTLNYEENGLFAKIIDIPSDDAVSSGFEYGVNDVDLETFIMIHLTSWTLRVQLLQLSNGRDFMADRLWL